VVEQWLCGGNVHLDVLWRDLAPSTRVLVNLIALWYNSHG
jgi:hypothetical protein